ncbi:MAG: hypothetical protein FJ191_09960 [Gammaproteobacteria bacterium]|nr:hypothetical protein [Gammaproteobacteria bacterium]
MIASIESAVVLDWIEDLQFCPRRHHLQPGPVRPRLGGDRDAVNGTEMKRAELPAPVAVTPREMLDRLLAL